MQTQRRLARGCLTSISMAARYQVKLKIAVKIKKPVPYLRYWFFINTARLTYYFYINPNPCNTPAPNAIPNIPITVVKARILAASMSLPPIALAIT